MVRLLPVATALLLVACGGAWSHAPLPAGPPLADEAARGLLRRRCSACHGAERVFGSIGTAEEWAAVVHRMVYHHKAKLLTHTTDREAAELQGWLTRTRGLDRPGVRIGHRPTGRPL